MTGRQKTTTARTTSFLHPFKGTLMPEDTFLIIALFLVVCVVDASAQTSKIQQPLRVVWDFTMPRKTLEQEREMVALASEIGFDALAI